MLIFGYSSAYAGKYININRIIHIESRGNSKAYNKGSGARGICQITPICLKEWNNFHKQEQYTLEDLWNKEINIKIAEWYLNVRIPQMLRIYKMEVTTRNILIAYNAGIKRVFHWMIPNETVKYIYEYNK
jgi:soluble lytic murein transglycosylase-like protein